MSNPTNREPTTEWRSREANRLCTGIYKPLPQTWRNLLCAMPDHYAHTSNDGTKVAFTTYPTKGEIDIQTTMRPGRYLTTYYPLLSPTTVQELVISFAPCGNFNIATSVDDIIRVYQGGPSSCMRYPSSTNRNYSGDIHPVAVYGDSDLALAYLGPIDDATARAIIYPKEKTYVRIYGDTPRLENALQAQGYRKAPNFSGAKITALPYNDTYIMPYLDGTITSVRLSPDNETFNIHPDGYDHATNTCGLLEEEQEEGEICENCEAHCDDTHSVIVTTTNRTEEWCSSCYEDSSFYCNGTNDTYSNDLDHYAVGENTYCAKYYSDHDGFYCERTNEHYIDTPSIILEDTNQRVSLHWAVANATCVADEWYLSYKHPNQLTLELEATTDAT